MRARRQIIKNPAFREILARYLLIYRQGGNGHDNRNFRIPDT